MGTKVKIVLSVLGIFFAISTRHQVLQQFEQYRGSLPVRTPFVYAPTEKKTSGLVPDPTLRDTRAGKPIVQPSAAESVTLAIESTKLLPSSKNAYAYLLGGVDPDDGTTYKGFFYNILLSTYILREGGSQSDIILLLQFKDPSTNTTLPKEDWDILRQMDIRVKILPHHPSNDHDFERLQMEKFQMWNLTEYGRIFYMDADVMPLCNLDYIFDLSYGPDALIKPNMVFPFFKVPAIGGIFLLEPSQDAYQRLRDLIEKRFQSKFDVVMGWGRKIEQEDIWQNWDGESFGTKWNFYAAHVDQGLLWHWMRYANGTFSIPYPRPGADFRKSRRREDAMLDNYVDGKLESSTVYNFTHSCLPRHLGQKNLRFIKHPWFKNGHYHFPFHSDFIHWFGKTKPWNKEMPDGARKYKNKFETRNGEEFWFYNLQQVEQLYNLTIDWSAFGRVWKNQNFRADSDKK